MVAALKQGQVRKMVLSRTITLQERAYEKAAVWYTALADRYPEAFVFLVFVPGKTCWLGATTGAWMKFWRDIPINIILMRIMNWKKPLSGL